VKGWFKFKAHLVSGSSNAHNIGSYNPGAALASESVAKSMGWSSG
jgi:hypothetical protein